MNSKKKTIEQAAAFGKRRRRRRLWYRILTVMSAFVVFVTTYILILPAITLSKDPICGKEEHTHTDECFSVRSTVTFTCKESLHSHTDECRAEDNSLVCGKADYFIHTHTDICYDSNGVLLCELPEITLHTHTDECYISTPAVSENEEDTSGCEETTVTDVTSTDDMQIEDAESTVGELESDKELNQIAQTDSTDNQDASVTSDAVDINTSGSENNVFCNMTESVIHIHTDECYDSDKKLICGMTEVTEHIHSEGCMIIEETKTLICDKEEHVHDDILCYPDEKAGVLNSANDASVSFAAKLTDEEQRQVDYVIGLIDAMPTADEIDATLLAFENEDDLDGYQLYFVDVGTQGKTAYNAYEKLNENQKQHVTNADKLMESSYVWSQVNLAATADARADDIQSVSGDGIKVQLFNYSKHINKTADHNAWRPIASYFTFRNSQSTPGDVPSDTVVVPTWNINSDHDIDGFTKTHATVERVLSENGTPILDLTRNADGSARVDPGVSREVRDMAYLFSYTGDPDVSVYNPTNTFLQKNGNYYWYDSAQNAVDYDHLTNLIRLRNYVERNSETAAYGAKYGDFTPFNYTNGQEIGLGSDGVTPYHVLNADVDYWFGMSMEVNFFQTKDGIINGEEMQFQFSGDDDVWVFVDDVLVLDLGGTHGTVDGSINFSTGEILQYLSWSNNNSTEDERKNGSTTSFPTTIRECFDAAGRTPNGGWNAVGTTFADYSEHTLKIFYMERGSAVANCKLSFSLPALPDKSLTVTKDLVTDETDGIQDYLKETLDYKFRVMKADSEGNSTGELFIKGGTTFDILENANKVGTGTVATDGLFTIKAGQSAQFTEMLLKGGGHINYVVEELLPDNATGQYSGIEYDVSGAGGETITDNDAVNNFTAYRTGKLSAEQTQAVTYRNKVDTAKLSYLHITKEKADNAVFPDEKEFLMQITLGDKLLPIGTKYTVDGIEKTVQTAGIIPLKAGQTAIIEEGIISGTQYLVKELNTVEENMLAIYQATAQPTGEVTVTANGVSGTVGTGSVIQIKVINQNNDFSLSIPLSKQIIDNDGEYDVTIEAVEVDPVSLEPITDIPGCVISVSGTSPVSGQLFLGYTAGTTGTKCYKVFENSPDDEFIYDNTFYIVQVNTTGDSAQLISIVKNGTESIDTSSVLSFVNRKTVKLNVTKEVLQKLSNDTFDFTATVTLDGEPYILSQPETGAGYTVDANTAYFTLSHAGTITIPYIPHGASVTLSEVNTDGYVVYYSVSGVHSELQAGSSVTLDFDTSDITVHFTNDAVYELPKTGGNGTYYVTIGGIWLVISASCVLWYKVKKRRKEDLQSF